MNLTRNYITKQTKNRAPRHIRKTLKGVYAQLFFLLEAPSHTSEHHLNKNLYIYPGKEYVCESSPFHERNPCNWNTKHVLIPYKQDPRRQKVFCQIF